jgi:hypothetical protein
LSVTPLWMHTVADQTQSRWVVSVEQPWIRPHPVTGRFGQVVQSDDTWMMMVIISVRSGSMPTGVSSGIPIAM